MPDHESEKKLAAEKSLDFIRNGMTIGLGTGSTASYFIMKLGEMVKEGLKIEGIPTSLRTQALARRVGIPLTDFSRVRRLDLTVDGTDEVDPDFNLIKGGGGALLREKIVASVTDQLVIVGDSRKPVRQLGAFPLPIEVIPFGWEIVAERISDLGAAVELRSNSTGQPFLTVENNYILDCRFGRIPDPEALARRLRNITGVVEHGLFVGLTKAVIVARGNRLEVRER